MHTLKLFSAVSLLAISASQSHAQMTMPTDADPSSCAADVSGWFPNGSGADGAATAPSSVSFTDDNPNGGDGPNICNFYQWGAQMFLWITSPDGDGRVLDGTAFFNVLADVNGQRKLQDASTAKSLSVGLRAAKGDEDLVDEVGQAGGGVLMSKNKSLVYYGVHVNDIYADFLTGEKTKAFDPAPTKYPRNATDMQTVLDYVETVGLEPPQAPDTLAIELKTSWVDASTVANPDDYITITGDVPIYDQSDDLKWVLQPGQNSIQLALVGVHIVGTVQDHPEFVWATFEHISNTADDSYWYSTDITNLKATAKEWAFDSSGSFEFLTTGAAATGANVQCMTNPPHQSTGDIIANLQADKTTPVCDGGIVASETVRVRPWGSYPFGYGDVGTTPSSQSDPITTEQVDAIVKNNTLLVALNSNVISQLASDDPRSKYVQTGGIWTTTVAGTTDAPIPNWMADEAMNMRGSLGLYNATMETYSQSFADNCFFCHSISKGDANSFGLSHVYGEIDPLPTK